MFHENWRAWQLFQLCATQWRRETVFTSHMTKPVVVRHGLDYQSVEAVMRMNGIRHTHHRKLFRKIQLIEFGALDGFHKRND